MKQPLMTTIYKNKTTGEKIVFDDLYHNGNDLAQLIKAIYENSSDWENELPDKYQANSNSLGGDDKEVLSAILGNTVLVQYWLKKTPASRTANSYIAEQAVELMNSLKMQLGAVGFNKQ